MGILDFFSRSKPLQSRRTLIPRWTEHGVEFIFPSSLYEVESESLANLVQDSNQDDVLVASYLSQLVSEGICELREYAVFLTWDAAYELLQSTEHLNVIQFLQLPALSDLRPILNNLYSISESRFQVKIEGWVDGNKQVAVKKSIGAVIYVNDSEMLLSESAWRMMNEIQKLNRLNIESKSQHENELAWGEIRYYADKAGAMYSSVYLETTYVLTPKSLRLPSSKEETPFGRVLTVSPTFDSAPDGWLKAFDGFNSVQPHYDLTRGSGRVRIVISEPVRQVLSVIKREMPGRRVAGANAEKFISNPWAFLGDTAGDVIKEDEYLADRGEAGAIAAIFSIVPRIKDGFLNKIDLVVTEHFSNGYARTDTAPFKDITEFSKFAADLEGALQANREFFSWKEFDLSIDAESTLQFEQAMQFLHLWRLQPELKISFEDIYELDGYSGRIEGIGVAKPVYVPVLQKPSGENNETGWLPSDLTPMVRVSIQGHDGLIHIPLSTQWVEDFETQILNAETNGVVELKNQMLPTPIATNQARSLLDSFRSMLGAEARVKNEVKGNKEKKSFKKETLLVKTNFHSVDYLEVRNSLLALPENAIAQIPHSIRGQGTLKPHQLHGVAWFQNLICKAPTHCRGALLADDMGLGKTLQLLTVIGWYYEKNPNASPSIIFAPKSLLENWANERYKFFNDSFPEVLILYGDELKSRKQPIGLVDSKLRDRELVNHLKPDWVGSAKLIITTYDVLTSYEFSFARQPFTFVICDEAQRIKTPGAIVTLIVKKLKADFRIACTGTPVENNLNDLWCLFDFVQPGLLGALESFGGTYRKPIECQTEGQKASIAKLQELISPQTLRRTKADIASLLKRKLFAYKSISESQLRFKERLELNERLEISMTEFQSVLYKAGLKKLQDANKEVDGKTRVRLSFGALHLMKAICAEPYCLPGQKFLPDSNGEATHLLNSPKLSWMLNQLRDISAIGEKAIVFTELREVQIALQYFLKITFGLNPLLIHGESKNRQATIDKFSGKEGFDVIILSTLAAGAGLNVTAANHVFHFTRAWNPAKEAQATDRAFRIGQSRDVYVYCPTVVANEFCSFEVRLDELLKVKAGLANATLDGGLQQMLNGAGGDISFSELSQNDESLGSVRGSNKKYLTMNDVDRLDGFSFEVFCNLLWIKMGFLSCITDKSGGDGGIDIVALKDKTGELIQCKSSINPSIGWDAIKEVTAGATKYQRKYLGTSFRKVAVTNQEFTSSAIIQAELNQVYLISRAKLEVLLGANPITSFEFEDELHLSISN